MKHSKQILSVLFSVLMLFSCIPFAASAQGETEPEEPTDWIEIYTYEDLDDVRYDLTANYKLMNDIDMTEWVKPGGDYDYYGQGWNPIGSRDVYADDAFSGIFDGNGHTISGLRMDVTRFPEGTGNTVFFGLFARVSGTVRNLTVAGSASVSDARRNNYVGGIVASLNSTGLIENCTNMVKLIVTGRDGTATSFFNYVGGIAGYGQQGTVQNCRNIASVFTTTSDNYRDYYYKNFVSGIVGYSYGANIYLCMNSGSIKSINNVTTYNASTYIDNVSGIACGSAIIKNCYNIGEVTSNTQYNFGISTSNSITNCYNIGTISGGVYNYAISSASSTNCFYLKGSGTTSTGATERTDAQMKRQITYQNWDFDNVWTMEGRDDYFYPELRAVPLLLPDDFKTPISGSISIDGEQEADAVLTANIDELTPEDATVSYSWKIDDAEISTTESYQLQAADIGKTLTLTVTGTGDYKGTLIASCVLGAPHEHTEEVIPAVPATCTEAGLTEGLKCSACGEILVAQEEIPANGHTPVTAGAFPETCGKAGFSGVTYCSVCNQVLDRGETIPATGVHTPGTAIETILTQATCTEAGEKKITVKCAVCGETISETTQETSALGHADADENGNCTRCGTHIKDVTNPGSNGSSQQSGGKTRTGFFGWLSNLFSRIFSIFKR